MREVPIKNYIIMTVIVISIFASTILLASIYNNRLKKTSIMYNYLSEIKKKDIDTYLVEKPNIILYISDKYDLSFEKAEKKLKNDIIKNNSKEYFVYLNIDNNSFDYIDKLNMKYNGNINKQLPVIVVIEDGQITKNYYELNNINLNELTGDIK